MSGMNKDTQDSFAEAAAAIEQDVVDDAAAASFEAEAADLGDVPSYFDVINGTSEESSDPAGEAAVSVTADQFTYTADGKEFTATREEAIRALALAKGSRKAFSDRAKLKRDLESARKEAQANSEFKKQWEAVLKDARSEKEVWERLTGKNFDKTMEEEQSRRQLYANASPDQRKILDYESQLNEINHKVNRAEHESKKRAEDAESKLMQSQVDYMKGVLVPELEKYAEKLSASNPHTSNRLVKMIYRNTIADLKELKAAGHSDEQLKSPAVLRKVLSRNAQAIIREDTAAVQAAVSKEVDKKKAVAKEQASVAATRNYPKAAVPDSELVKMDPLALFNKMFKKG